MMWSVETGRVEVSRREADVLAGVGARLSNAEIAAQLFLSVRTVESHVSSLLRKFGVGDRWALVDRARELSAAGPVVGLPSVRTSLVGRAAERVTVASALADTRLVTLVGPGGIGKTRLSGVVAEETSAGYPGGVAFVDLVPVRAGFLAQAVAAVLGVVEGPQQPLESAIADRLRQAGSLLVLDNCEHVIDAAAQFVDRLLANNADVRVLATSRERLGVADERVVEVGPLPPDDAVALFLDRATTVDKQFDGDPVQLADLCARLDGLPLALELAAARGAALGLDGLISAAGDQLRLLSGGRGGQVRHRSLRSVLAWSYELLDDDVQATFRRLSVFVGGFDLAAAAEVAGRDLPVMADELGRLVDQSLVVHERSARRWRMLTIVRAYAADRLLAAETDEVRQRHLQWATKTARELESTPDSDFDTVAADLRAAAEYGPASYDLIASLGRLTFRRRFLREAADHFQAAAQLVPERAAEHLMSAADCVFIATASGSEAHRLLRSAAEQAHDTRTRILALSRAVESAGRHQVVRSDGLVDPQVLAAYDDAVAGAAVYDDPVLGATVAVAGAWIDPAARAGTALTAARRSGDPVLISSAIDAVGYELHRTGRTAEAVQLNRERSSLIGRLNPDDPRSAAEIGDIYLSRCVDVMFTGDLPAALAAARALPAGDLYGADSYVATGMQIAPLVLTGELQTALSGADRILATWRRSGQAPSGLLPPVFAMAFLASRLLGDAKALDAGRTR